jgi:hypothetical protein
LWLLLRFPQLLLHLLQRHLLTLYQRPKFKKLRGGVIYLYRFRGLSSYLLGRYRRFAGLRGGNHGNAGYHHHCAKGGC